MVSERAFRAAPRNLTSEADAEGVAANLSCGSFIRLYLTVDDGSVVKDIGVSSNGCGYMLAAADVLCEFGAGRQLSELHGLNDSELSALIKNLLGPLPEDRTLCAKIAIEALRSAFADLRSKRVEEFRGETPLICSCFGVSQDRIEAAIWERSLETVDEVTDVCNAGRGCGSCRMLIQELLDTTPR